MFPLLLLAFASLILGITYIFPSEWLLTQSLSTITMYIFSAFNYLVYFSLIITFHKSKNKYTMINALLFLLVVLTMQFVIKDTTKLESYLLSNSVFSMIIIASVFIFVDKFIYTKPYLWVGVGFLLSLILVFVFIIVAYVIRQIGTLIGLMPYGLNAFFYGTINRLLLPFGLHSLLIPTFTYTSVGGTLEVTNVDTSTVVEVINGDSAIWTYMYTHGMDFQSIAGTYTENGVNYSYELINTNAPGQYQEGFLLLTTFIFPIMGITYVIFNGWEKGKNIFVATMITACSGLTEVTEYTFLYTNIYLYLMEVVSVGLSFMLCNVLDVSVWISTGWFIDIILFGIIPSLNGFVTNWYWIPIVGTTIGVVFALLFNLVDKMSKTHLSV